MIPIPSSVWSDNNLNNLDLIAKDCLMALLKLDAHGAVESYNFSKPDIIYDAYKLARQFIECGTEIKRQLKTNESAKTM